MDITRKTRKQLYELTRQFNLPSKSDMNKDKLIKMLMPFLSSTTRLPSMSSTALAKLPADFSDKIDKRPSVSQTSAPPTEESDPYPIPDSYDRDLLTLMPVDPSSAYACWELSSRTKAKYQTEQKMSSFHILLKLCMNKKGGTCFLESLRVGEIGSYFFHHYLPREECWVEMSIGNETGKYFDVMKSRHIIMPDDHIHDTEEVMFMTVQKNIQGLLVLSKNIKMKISETKIDTTWNAISSTEFSGRQK